MNFSFLRILQRFSLALMILTGVGAFARPCLAYTSNEANTISVYDRVAGSVVNISTTLCEPETRYCAVPSAASNASGIVIKEDGTIVTSRHVVASAQTIQVTLADGRHLEATLISSAPEDDIAVIRVNVGDKPLQAIPLGDSERLKVGEKILSIGNPFGIGQSLSVGIVSMLHRNIKKDELTLKDLIQTDAAINPGNSGGALVNSKGELVGMNTAILTPTGASVRLGFAIPVNRIKKLTPLARSR